MICAAGAVLTVLLSAGLRAGHEFRIAPHLTAALPVTFTITENLPDNVARQLRAIPEMTIT